MGPDHLTGNKGQENIRITCLLLSSRINNLSLLYLAGF
jgi:hypothetical protein